ncbi:MAG TPA: hypothetical protein VGJ28_23195 [Micromonosporaceae bacterium]
MNSWTAMGIAVVFVWLGMVLAISFLEAPLKFRAPDVTLPIGLGIGRLVYRAFNAVEVVLATALLIAITAQHSSAGVLVSALIAIGALTIQLIVVRPRLTRRSNAVLAGADAPRSHVHHAYVVLELLKAAALIAAGVLLLQ